MANGQGGARIGAGRKKKALADNIADGNPGKRKLTVLDFNDAAADLTGQDMPPPKAFLAAKQKNGKDLIAVEIYTETWQWLAERDCAHLIPKGNGTQYGRIVILPFGTKLEYVATAENGWHAVVVNDQVGWISGNFSKLL